MNKFTGIELSHFHIFLFLHLLFIRKMCGKRIHKSNLYDVKVKFMYNLKFYILFFLVKLRRTFQIMVCLGGNREGEIILRYRKVSNMNVNEKCM